MNSNGRLMGTVNLYISITVEVSLNLWLAVWFFAAGTPLVRYASAMNLSATHAIAAVEGSQPPVVAADPE